MKTGWRIEHVAMLEKDETPTDLKTLMDISMILNSEHTQLFGRRVPERVHCAFATTFRTVLQQTFGNVRHVLCVRTINPNTPHEQMERTAVTANDMYHACIRNWLISVGYIVGRIPAQDALCMFIFNTLLAEARLFVPR